MEANTERRGGRQGLERVRRSIVAPSKMGGRVGEGEGEGESESESGARVVPPRAGERERDERASVEQVARGRRIVGGSRVQSDRGNQSRFEYRRE